MKTDLVYNKHILYIGNKHTENKHFKDKHIKLKPTKNKHINHAMTHILVVIFRN
jgi:hypothetical protein